MATNSASGGAVGTALRVLLATIGAYALAVAVGAASARLLPMPRVEAAMIGTLLCVPVTAFGAICAFAVRSVRTAFGVILVPALVLGAMAWLAGQPA